MAQNTNPIVEKPPRHEKQNEIFDALVSHRSRYVLYACIQTDERLRLSDVTKQVAGWEYGKEITAVTSEEHKRIYTSLQQHHLPKLERAELVTIDDDENLIRCTEKAKNLDLYIELVPQSDVPWSLYYLGFGLISGFVLALSWLEVLPDRLSASILAMLIVTGLVISALVHYKQSRQLRLGSDDLSVEIDD